VKIYIVQDDPTETFGRIWLVTASKEKARQFCFDLLVDWNDDASVQDHAKNLPRGAFLDMYLHNNAWVTSPELSEFEVEDKNDDQ
jgi:hypothetical protein